MTSDYAHHRIWNCSRLGEVSSNPSRPRNWNRGAEVGSVRGWKPWRMEGNSVPVEDTRRLFKAFKRASQQARTMCALKYCCQHSQKIDGKRLAAVEPRDRGFAFQSALWQRISRVDGDEESACGRTRWLAGGRQL